MSQAKLRVIVRFHDEPDVTAFTDLGLSVLNRINTIKALVTEATPQEIAALSDDPRVFGISYSSPLGSPR